MKFVPLTAASTVVTVALAGSLALSTGASPQDPEPSAPKELGHVGWGRQLEPALEASQKDGKPLWLLFQEVPG